VRAGQNDGVTFRVAQPAFPMRILTAMAGLEDISFHLLCARHGGVEIAQFEPKENTIAIRLYFGLSEWAMMMFDAPVVQLKYQRSIGRDQSFVL
jgi:hypothetical protein